MQKYVLPSESDATHLVIQMARIIDQQGHVTVAQVHDLLGFSHTFVDERNGWTTTNHVLNPISNPDELSGGVSLELPDPVAIKPEVKLAQGVLRLTMEFDSSENVEKALMELLREADILKGATAWSLTRRPRGGPRVSYSSPISRGDDI